MKKLRVSFFLVLSLNGKFIHAQNPGNVGTANLTAWFKADALPNGNVATWTTTFPTGGSAISLNDATTPWPQATNTPAGYTSNYNVTINFTGNLSGSQRVLTNASALNLLNNNVAGDQGTLFTVYYKPQGMPLNGHIVHYREGSGDGIQLRQVGGGTFRLAVGSTATTSASRDYGVDYKTNLVSYKGNRSGVATLQAHKRINPIATGAASNATGDVGLHIGGGKFGGVMTDWFQGFISEVIFYNTDLATLDYNKVSTYLAVKFGITLDNTAGGAQGNYIATNGNVVWTASLTPGYHRDVIGIARDDNEGLLQKQSHSFDDTTRLYLNTLSTTNAGNQGTFSVDQSYVIMGNDAGKVCATPSSNLEIPSGFGIYSRLEREWKVTKTSFGNSFNWDVTLNGCANPTLVNPADLVLLVDDDGNFINASVYAAGAGLTFSYSYPIITVSGLSNAQIPDNNYKYITIASLNSVTPLPIELLDFAAKCENQTILLNWRTASEKNNKQFEIQRSLNGTDFITLDQVKGQGNSTSITNYHYVDFAAPAGTIYYRLKQTNYNNDFTYYPLVVYFNNCTEYSGNSDFSVYPNPNSGSSIQITYTVKNDEDVQFSILDPLGKICSDQKITLTTTGSEASLYMGDLAKGIYFLRINSAHINKKPIKIIKE